MRLVWSLEHSHGENNLRTYIIESKQKQQNKTNF